MRRFAWFGGVALASATACSLINAPPDAEPQGSGGSGGGCRSSTECTQLDDACNQGACVNGACVAQPVMDGKKCDDGLYCTDVDTCKAGKCVGKQRACPTKKACDLGVCNEAKKACEEQPGHDGMACDDGNPCDDPGSCMGGQCTKGPEKCSKLSTECATGTCSATGCTTVPSNEGGACNLSNTCAPSLCMQGMCTVQTAMAQPDGTGCDDGLFCTLDEKCMAGICTPSNHSICPPNNAGCGTWTCDEANKTCVPSAKNEGMSCSFGSCENGQTCQGGLCIGQPTGVYFSEDFKDNSKGWTLDGDWQIGPAKKSLGGQLVGGMNVLFSEDPDEDHTPNTLDNGVAGVNIGGLADTTVHGFYYLTSPPFNASLAPGQLTLGFYRWLNSDYPPFMDDTVEVWNGAGWQQLFHNQMGTPLNDAKWTYVTYDLTPYKNPAMQVRFGYDVTQMGVFMVSSWNVDDVVVADSSCP